MTDAQKADLALLRVKASQQDTVTVPKDALIIALNATSFQLTAKEAVAIHALRKAAGIE